ncbi:uncharacterized protein BDZ99DRAFT_487733 [Mytilinidion resinicola]|uniref:Protein kinase domain-containing protein n=1 Tax=Mytilinidion resinicola TaxID=574789 RepID=A0A6A6YQ27_9PEZI|nr:uncharacterized protein BDZ99DRAFT_487733 [Mytilinidion resinicola]KAF2811006.1 hypothetical protein BDZ99DRAFT_487733 [Mytilinidion resinicola]
MDLEIVEFNEVFAETDDDLEFSHTKVITQRNGQIFSATIKSRIQRKEEIDTSRLKMTPIPQEHVYPILPTQAPSSLSVDRSPHPNVAKYFGCHIDERGLIIGLCFKKYNKTLYEMVKGRDTLDAPKCLSSIKAGIEHLHSLGIIHCDINPHNIFLDTSTFVIGDFDSCTFEGDELGMKAGTDGWTNDEFELAQRENDWFGFTKIEEFLSSSKGRK